MKLFVIIFEQRSGSTHLVSLLNSHREIRARGEVFDGKKVRQKVATTATKHAKGLDQEGPVYRRQIACDGDLQLDPDSRNCTDLIQSWVDDSKHVSGFKFKYPKQAKLFPEVDRFLKRIDEGLRVIVLRRDNLVRRALSHFNHVRIRAQTGKSNFRSEDQTLNPIQLDLDSFVEYVNKLAELRDEFLQYAGGFTQTLHIDYEELLNDSSSIERIQEFIGVKEIRPLTSRVVKATPTDLDQAILNFDQFQNRMVDEGMQDFLKRAA